MARGRRVSTPSLATLTFMPKAGIAVRGGGSTHLSGTHLKLATLRARARALRRSGCTQQAAPCAACCIWRHSTLRAHRQAVRKLLKRPRRPYAVLFTRARSASGRIGDR